MDLSTRKYNFIQELIHIEKESIIVALENVLKQEKEGNQDISLSNKKELDNRLESYTKNPNDVLDWESIKDSW